MVIVTPTQGLPSLSRTCPETRALCADAIAAQVRIMANANMARVSRFIWNPQVKSGIPPPLLSRNWRPIGDRISQSRLLESPQTQAATIARAASFVIKLIAGPGALQRRSQLRPAPDNFAFLQIDHRRHDADLR